MENYSVQLDDVTQEQEPEQEEQLTPDSWDDQNWIVEDEGQLAVDVYQRGNDIVVKATVAGVRPEDLDIAVNDDMVTIRGYRYNADQITEENYFFKECYWGGFSRTIILPTEVRTDQIKASMKNGVLTLIFPKTNRPRSVNVQVEEES